MLSQVRGALKGIGAWFVIILLILAFALWGVPEVRNMARNSPIRVGNEGFSSRTIQNEFNRQMTARRDESGRPFTREEAIAAGLPDQVVSSIATRAVLEQEAGKMGLVMPRELVRDYLHNNENFQNPATGRFDEFVLQSILSNNGYSVRQFESLVKQDLLRNQLVDSVAAGAPAPDSFAEMILLRQIERRQVGYLTITDAMAGVPAEPTPDALQQFYDDHQDDFMAPEYRTFTAVILRQNDFTEGLEPDEAELREAYEARREQNYEFPERRTIHQITYDTEAQAQAAVSALRQGKPFEDLAVERGLTLNAVTFNEVGKGEILDPSVAEAAFSPDFKAGDVAEPVQSLFGWTVIQLAGVTPPETKSFEDAREELVSQFTEQDSRKRLFETIEAIEQSRDTGAGLDAAAKEAGVSAKRFGPVDSFSMAPGKRAIIDGIPGEVLAEAFQLEEGEESIAAELEDGGYFFVQVDDITPAALRPYEDVSEQVSIRWRAEERRSRIGDAVKQVTDAVAGGASLDEAAAPFNRAVLQTVLSRGRPVESFSPELVERIFNANLNDVVSGGADSGDAQSIAEVRLIGFARSEAGPGEVAAFKQYLSYQLNQELLEAYVTALRDEYGVRIDQSALAAIFSDAP